MHGLWRSATEKSGCALIFELYNNEILRLMLATFEPRNRKEQKKSPLSFWIIQATETSVNEMQKNLVRDFFKSRYHFSKSRYQNFGSHHTPPERYWRPPLIPPTGGRFDGKSPQSPTRGRSDGKAPSIPPGREKVRVGYRNGLSRWAIHPRKRCQGVRKLFHVCGVRRMLCCLSASNMLSSWSVVGRSMMTAFSS